MRSPPFFDAPPAGHRCRPSVLFPGVRVPGSGSHSRLEMETGACVCAILQVFSPLTVIVMDLFDPLVFVGVFALCPDLMSKTRPMFSPFVSSSFFPTVISKGQGLLNSRMAHRSKTCVSIRCHPLSAPTPPSVAVPLSGARRSSCGRRDLFSCSAGRSLRSVRAYQRWSQFPLLHLGTCTTTDRAYESSLTRSDVSACCDKGQQS